eukprot:8060796-Pyramimonas_sp.AAC.1
MPWMTTSSVSELGLKAILRGRYKAWLGWTALGRELTPTRALAHGRHGAGPEREPRSDRRSSPSTSWLLSEQRCRHSRRRAN